MRGVSGAATWDTRPPAPDALGRAGALNALVRFWAQKGNRSRRNKGFARAQSHPPAHVPSNGKSAPLAPQRTPYSPVTYFGTSASCRRLLRAQPTHALTLGRRPTRGQFQPAPVRRPPPRPSPPPRAHASTSATAPARPSLRPRGLGCPIIDQIAPRSPPALRSPAQCWSASACARASIPTLPPGPRAASCGRAVARRAVDARWQRRCNEAAGRTASCVSRYPTRQRRASPTPTLVNQPAPFDDG